jgi:predicted aspartyl protease
MSGSEGEIMSTKIEKYGNRNWAVYLILPSGEKELIAVTVYKKGAASVAAVTNALIAARGAGVKLTMAA